MNIEKKPKSKKERTKEKIFKTAVSLFLEQGYENTTVQEITEKADIAKGTFFSHFPTKDAILTYLGEQRIEMMKGDLAKELGYINSAKEQILRLFELLATVNEENKKITKLISFEIIKLYSSKMEREEKNLLELKEIMEGILKSGQQSGEFKNNFHANLVADILIGTYFFILLRWLSEDKPTSLTKEYKESVSVILGGITAED